MEHTAPNRTGQAHPIVGILHGQGRKATWLAGQANVSRSYASLMCNGRRPATPHFRAACAKALGLPESVLFHDDGATPLTDERRIA
jgi:hypothetical protein